mmetsp:Transcript_39479/g.108766  ORF Transcript_39479/g.108766 Transcript_39479/m.108766 type:complete len:464 (-) Transcript_39479:96-1487(-)
MKEALLTDGQRAEAQLDYRRNVDDLPDLSDRLREQGVYQEYVEWRTSYMRWRKGEAVGAKGENTTKAHSSRVADFAYWYPTVTMFTFRRTLAFWIGVFCVKGCLLFLWICYFNAYVANDTTPTYSLTKFPNLIGGCCFFASAYLSYFELINMDSDVDANKINYVRCDFKLLSNLGIEIYTPIGCISYVVGAMFYTVAQIGEIFEAEGALMVYLVEWPYILGGFLFAAAGVCELFINKVFTSLPNTYPWWSSSFNFVGGICFYLSALPSVVGDEGDRWTAIGCFFYLAAATIVLWMWRGEQFGGSIIPALNRAMRDNDSEIVVRREPTTGVYHIIANSSSLPRDSSKEDAHTFLGPKLSWRGLMFLQVYVCVGVIQIISACGCFARDVAEFERAWAFKRYLTMFFGDVCNVCIVLMILVLTSACVTVPDQQPYRTLAVMMRFLSIVILANSLLTLRVILDDHAV